MTACTCPACSAALAWLRSLTPDLVALDRAAHMSETELRMLQHTHTWEAA